MRRLVVLAVLGCVAVGGAGVAPAVAAPAAPTLKAKYNARNDEVRLTWRTRGIDRRAITLIELERSADGSEFNALDVRPRRPSKYTDVPETGGTYWYRARVLSDNDVSGWSRTVAVDVPLPAGAPGGGTPPSGDPPLKAGQRECAAGTADAVLALVNDARGNLGALRLQAQLQWAARKRAIDMAAAGKLSHDGWTAAVNASGYPWSYLGENIALGYGTPSLVVSAWLGSSGHRANILGAFRDIGVGCVVDAGGRAWWAEIFGR